MQVQRRVRQHYVYVLFDGEELIYVGRTVNLAQRLGVFQRRTGITTSGQYYPFSRLADAQSEELRLIALHRPKFNTRLASSPTRLGQRNSPAMNAGISASMRGKALSPEHKAALWRHRTHRCKRGPDGRFVKEKR